MVERALGWALRTGVRKGLVGGSGPWLVVAVAAGAMRLLRRQSRPQAITLSIHPGERYTIAAGDETTLGPTR